jgi:excinuclease ABC subunit C
MNTKTKQQLIYQIKKLPTSPGVYLFKDSTGEIIYIGKAKNLRSRVTSYINKKQTDFKTNAIVAKSISLEYITTKTELEALLLEAKLILSYQPKHNVLFKDGQPFLYIVATKSYGKKLPELLLTKTKKQPGTYFGPFIERGPARKAYAFLLKTFKLRLCGKKINNGCLHYHLGNCSGSCKSNFDTIGYLERLELAKKSLKKKHTEFLEFLNEKLIESNKNLEFEKSKELHGYHEAFKKVFATLDLRSTFINDLSTKEIWIITPDKKALFLFYEQDRVLKKKRVFYFTFEELEPDSLNYLLGYYRTSPPAQTILINFSIFKENIKLVEDFLNKWHNQKIPINLSKPSEGHFANLVRMATIHAKQDLIKKSSVVSSLKKMLKLTSPPYTIDCFDISHIQGAFLVGSCIRFKAGKPEKSKFRKFKIKTVNQNNDYACLREIVGRRYHKKNDLPDLILIDGGKGQLNAVQDLFPKIEFVSLAKRKETIYSRSFPSGKNLDQKTYAAQMLIAIRNYAHHFAISYHRKLRASTNR